MIRRLPLLVCLAALVGGLAACGEKSESTTAPQREALRLMLDFFPNADHAPIFAAVGSGEFDRAGLDVSIESPSDPAAPLKLLAAGRVDLAISYEPELLLARDKGQDLVAVAALVNAPLTSIMSLGPHGIHDPVQLRDKTVGTAGIPYQSAYLQAILRTAGVDPTSVHEVNVGFNLVPAMLTRKVDATLGAFWNYEGVQLAQERRRPAVIRMTDAGIPTYDELVVVARARDLAQGGARVRRFIRALSLGLAAIKRDPNAGVNPLLAANTDLKRPLQLASVKATLPVFTPPAGKPYGYMDRAQWNAYGQWMFDHELLSKPPNAAAAFTDEFLPGQGLTDDAATP